MKPSTPKSGAKQTPSRNQASITSFFKRPSVLTGSPNPSTDGPPTTVGAASPPSMASPSTSATLTSTSTEGWCPPAAKTDFPAANNNDATGKKRGCSEVEGVTADDFDDIDDLSMSFAKKRSKVVTAGVGVKAKATAMDGDEEDEEDIPVRGRRTHLPTQPQSIDGEGESDDGSKLGNESSTTGLRRSLRRLNVGRKTSSSGQPLGPVDDDDDEDDSLDSDCVEEDGSSSTSSSDSDGSGEDEEGGEESGKSDVSELSGEDDAPPKEKRRGKGPPAGSLQKIKSEAPDDAGDGDMSMSSPERTDGNVDANKSSVEDDKECEDLSSLCFDENEKELETPPSESTNNVETHEEHQVKKELTGVYTPASACPAVNERAAALFQARNTGTSNASTGTAAGKSIVPVSSDEDEVSKKAKLLRCGVSEVSQYYREYVEIFFLWSGDFSFPSWLHPDKLRDRSGKQPHEEGYDITTMSVPRPGDKTAKAEPKHMTPAMEQYWEIKSDNFDKIVFFKMGRFYEIFYIDAGIAQRVCDLRWMGSEEKPHVGFPEQSLHHHAKAMVNAGFKVVVVEQMETPKELEERNKTAATKIKAVRRDICEVYSKGTLVHGTMLEPESRFLLSVCFDSIHTTSPQPSQQALCDTAEPTPSTKLASPSSTCYGFGFSFVDVTTCCVCVGYEPDGRDRLALRTMMMQLMPAEVCYGAGNAPTDVLKIIKALPTPPQLSCTGDYPGTLSAVQCLDRFVETHQSEVEEGEGREQWDSAIHLLRSHDSSLRSFAGLVACLNKALLADKVMRYASVKVFRSIDASHLTLDAEALRNLEILQTQEGGRQNSLYAYLNHTVTPFGNRLLKVWVTSPLSSRGAIECRLDCVEWLMKHSELMGKCRKRLGKVGDVERLMGRVSSQAVAGERGAVFFDDVMNKRVKEFNQLLDAFEEIDAVASIIVGGDGEGGGSGEKGEMPVRLKALVTSQPNGGMFPELKPIIEKLRGNFTKEGESWVPASGIDSQYDTILTTIERIKNDLKAEMTTITQKLKIPLSQAKFTHTKDRYEIEVPDSYELSSSCFATSARKGFHRFHTEVIKELVRELDEVDQQKDDAMYPFLQSVFSSFHSHYTHFTAVIRIISEIDCLMGLAIISEPSTGVTARPSFVEMGENGKAILEIVCGRHPVAASLMTSGTFIPNDTHINTGPADGATTLLVTGPNMGGKSTVLRQTCIIVIMAHLGCYVPGECFVQRSEIE
eukprot:GHVN01055211.1.p1 GENE.GHVN01055211.1~~GHVN01055211.1.p1  ORF type:complete len:1231 (+),score=304.56 GHVN01055211.1:120-3812(+)